MAHKAKDCFEETSIVGWIPGSEPDLDEKTDLDLLDDIDQFHVLTSIKVCTDRAETRVLGIQVSQAKFNG